MFQHRHFWKVPAFHFLLGPMESTGQECVTSIAENIDLHSDPKTYLDDTLEKQIALIESEIQSLENELGGEGTTRAKDSKSIEFIEIEHFKIPEHAIPIRCDVRIFPWKVK